MHRSNKGFFFFFRKVSEPWNLEFKTWKSNSLQPNINIKDSFMTSVKNGVVRFTYSTVEFLCNEHMQCYIVDGIIYNHWISGAINRGRQPFIFCGSHACILYGYYHSAYSTVLDIAYSTIRASLKVAVHYSIIQFQVNTIILATTISTAILWVLWHTSNTDGLCAWTQLCIMCLSSCVLFAKLYLHHTLTGPLFDPLWKN